MNNQEQPVLIIGAGPVGLSLAIALMNQSVPVIIFEALPKLSDEIRASTIHPATLEMFAEWGVIDEILAHGQKVDRLCFWERQTRECIAEFDYNVIHEDTPFPFRLQCPQSVLTRALRPLIEKSPLATIRLSHELVTFRDFGNQVEATFHTPTGPKIVEGSFLCGADGANSIVRNELSLSFDGMTYADRFLLVGTDLDLKPHFPDNCLVNYIYDPAEWIIILHLPDLVRFVFRLPDDEGTDEALQETAVQQRITRFLKAKAQVNIRTRAAYRVHQRVADTFRVGRVMLLGDAAHLNNPFGGMGMNSGIHDAHFLAPRLTAVLQGSSEHLLDEYSRVRREIALNIVNEYSDKKYRDLSAADEAVRRQRNEKMRQMAANPARARAYLLRASMLDDRI